MVLWRFYSQFKPATYLPMRAKSSSGSLLKILVLAALGGVAQAAPLQMDSMSTPHDGEFFAVKTGPFWLQSVTASSGSLSTDFKFDARWGVTIPLGWELGNGFSFAFSGGYYQGRISNIVGHSGGSSQSLSMHGDLDFIPLMASVAWKTKLTDHLRWYIGVGVGGVRQSGTLTDSGNSPAHSVDIGGQRGVIEGLDGSNWHLGFEAFTGFAYDFTDSLALTLGYRYLHVNSNIKLNGSASGDFAGHSVELGLMMRL